ncbi:alpha/beta fold hydrolase [Oceanobacillus chungangensis]|uniref:Alpha/beta hydrolase n=1 Tax=Oceanobacillus chungangensis TaxID=1229152 RepID=A0A3D8PIQ5_9BACI|nr:alpha/beta hydrolase [Oceanobacillus chungangensis]RDW15121.1 alpha/beta hydrolase [Oceanobacillus chungangensis]
MKFITSDGLELYYDKSGKGFPCIYLHGGPGYWSKSFQYFSQELLEEKLEMVYLDQRGCGRSKYSPTQDYSLSRLIEDIEELRIFLGLSEWYVMGHSFGGILAVNYAERYTERTKGLILSNVTLNMFDSFRHLIQKGTDILGMKKERIQCGNLESFMDIFYSILSKLMEKEEYFKFQYANLKNKKIVDKIDEGLNSDPKFQQYVFSSDEYFQDFTSLTEQINRPVLVIAGKLDEAVGPDHHQNFKFKNPKIRVLLSSHHPYIGN